MDGEGLETPWAFLSPLVSSLRVSTRLHWLNSIQERSDYYSDQIMEGSGKFFTLAQPLFNPTQQFIHIFLGNWLRSKMNSSKDAYHSANLTLNKLHSKIIANRDGKKYTNDFFAEQWKLEQEYHLNANPTLEKQRLELGRLLCLEKDIIAGG